MAPRIAAVCQMYTRRIEFIEVYRYRIKKVEAGANDKVVFNLFLPTVVDEKIPDFLPRILLG